MKKYVLYLAVCMVSLSLSAIRQPFDNRKHSHRPQKPIAKPQRVRPPRIKPPAPPAPKRLLHVVVDERDKNELTTVLQHFKFVCSSCVGLKGSVAAPCDLLVVSDMNALESVFSQADAFKHIILWIRGRCSDDQCEHIRALASRENVHMVIYTPYEKQYMEQKGVPVDRAVVIWPPYVKLTLAYDRSTLFLPAGLKESYFKRVVVACAAQAICIRDDAYRATGYGTASEGMLCFPGILPDHLLFEHLQQGVVQFVPTIRFLKRLGFVPKNLMDVMHTSEWYCPDYADFIQYFNSWDDLKTKMREIDYEALTKKMEQLGMDERKEAVTSWKQLFEDLVR